MPYVAARLKSSDTSADSPVSKTAVGKEDSKKPKKDANASEEKPDTAFTPSN